MRVQVLREEPLCVICLAKNPPEITPSCIADHKVPKAEGGTDDRDNYQGICRPCDIIKTAAEAARARARNNG
jgi:5-methylcytosine-specific restriction protein A